jgi:hypothetical protein
MEPSQFYFLILPLASLVFILVAVVVLIARKDEDRRITEIQLLNELIRTGSVSKTNFITVLQELFEKKVIDKASFKRMGELLENYLNETNEETIQEPKEIFL